MWADLTICINYIIVAAQAFVSTSPGRSSPVLFGENTSPPSSPVVAKHEIESDDDGDEDYDDEDEIMEETTEEVVEGENAQQSTVNEGIFYSATSPMPFTREKPACIGKPYWGYHTEDKQLSKRTITVNNEPKSKISGSNKCSLLQH